MFALHPQFCAFLHLIVVGDAEVLQRDGEGLLRAGVVEGCEVDAAVCAQREEVLSVVVAEVVLFVSIQRPEAAPEASYSVYIGVQKTLFGTLPAEGVVATTALVAGAEVVCHKHHSRHGSTCHTSAVLANRGRALVTVANEDNVVRVVELIEAVGPPSSADGIHGVLRLVDTSPCVAGDAPTGGVTVGEEGRDGEVQENAPSLAQITEVFHAGVVGFHSGADACVVVTVGLYDAVVEKVGFHPFDAIVGAGAHGVVDVLTGDGMRWVAAVGTIVLDGITVDFDERFAHLCFLLSSIFCPSDFVVVDAFLVPPEGKGCGVASDELLCLASCRHKSFALCIVDVAAGIEADDDAAVLATEAAWL